MKICVLLAYGYFYDKYEYQKSPLLKIRINNEKLKSFFKMKINSIKFRLSILYCFWG